MSNVKFNYVYRDGSNYKNWADVTFRNPDNLGVESLTRTLQAAFDDSLFIAHQVRLPEVFAFPDGIVDSDDHCYHEFCNVEITDDIPNDLFGRSIREFLAEVQSSCGKRVASFLQTN